MTLNSIPERRSRKQRVNESKLVLGDAIQSVYMNQSINQFEQKPERFVGNASWNSIDASKRPKNTGKTDAWNRRQQELHSSVLDQTDYS